MSTPEFMVHTVASGPETFLTNAFLVETAESLVAVDTMMTVSDARTLRRHVDAIGKPLKAVLVTHGHPDHYNGTGELLEGLGKIPVIATVGVARTMRRTDDAKELRWRPVFGEEWPRERTFPDRFISDGETLAFDGVPFAVRELGPGESLCDLVWAVGTGSRAIFAGDVVFGGGPLLHERRPYHGLAREPRPSGRGTVFGGHSLYGPRGLRAACRHDLRPAALPSPLPEDGPGVGRGAVLPFEGGQGRSRPGDEGDPLHRRPGRFRRRRGRCGRLRTLVGRPLKGARNRLRLPGKEIHVPKSRHTPLDRRDPLRVF